MALSAYAIWEVRSLGSDNNSGGFDPGATMKSTLSCSNGTSATPTVTASDYTFCRKMLFLLQQNQHQ